MCSLCQAVYWRLACCGHLVYGYLYFGKQENMRIKMSKDYKRGLMPINDLNASLTPEQRVESAKRANKASHEKKKKKK